MENTKNVFLAVAVISVLTGCAIGPRPVYQVHRAALVQPPAPPAWSGKVDGFGASLGNSSVLWNNAPRRAAGSESGLYVASTQFDGTLRLGVGEHVAFWVPMSYGLSSQSFAAAPCLIDRPDEGVFSAGLGVALSGQLSHRLYMGFSLEYMLASIPSRVQAECVGNCLLVPNVSEDQDSTIVGQVRAVALLGVDLDWVRIFGGLAGRNHPVNEQRDLVSTYCPDCISTTVGHGPMYLMPGFGAEFRLWDGVRLLTQVYQPLPVDNGELIYGPILGVSLHVNAG